MKSRVGYVTPVCSVCSVSFDNVQAIIFASAHTFFAFQMIWNIIEDISFPIKAEITFCV